MHRCHFVCLAFVLFWGLAACTKDAEQAKTAHGAAGIVWTVPASWQPQGAKAMRVSTHRIPRAAGDTEDGEFAVFHFGKMQGGSATANIERWLGQKVQPEGAEKGLKELRSKQTVAGLNVTTLDVDGTYMYSPRPMAPTKTPKPNYRMLAAVVEAPGGNVFFKLTAPAKTADRQSFEQVIQSIRMQ